MHVSNVLWQQVTKLQRRNLEEESDWLVWKFGPCWTAVVSPGSHPYWEEVHPPPSEAWTSPSFLAEMTGKKMVLCTVCKWRSLEPNYEWTETVWMLFTSPVKWWRAVATDEFSHYDPFNPWQICCAVNKGAINANYDEFVMLVSLVLAWGPPHLFQKGYQSSDSDYQLLVLGLATCWEFP